MSGIYINGMEMLKEGSYEAVFLFGPNGKAEIAVSPGEGKVGYWKEYQVISVPPHGRLIDADALREQFSEPKEELGGWRNPDEAVVHKTGVWAEIDAAPTIIPTDGG